MPEHPLPDDLPSHRPIEHAHVHREQTDVRLRPILGVVLAIAVGLAIVIVSARLLFNRGQVPPQAQSPASIADESPRLPAQPRLEPLEPQSPAAAASFAAHQREQERLLRSLGKTDEADFAHVPIDQAIRHVARGLQEGKQPAKRDPKSTGLVGGGEANSGRLFHGGSP
jgi:hypothetical protein